MGDKGQLGGGGTGGEQVREGGGHEAEEGARGNGAWRGAGEGERREEQLRVREEVDEWGGGGGGDGVGKEGEGGGGEREWGVTGSRGRGEEGD